MRNVPHTLLCLNSWSSLVALLWEVMEPLGGAAWLEEVHYTTRVALGSYSVASLPICPTQGFCC